MLGEERQSDSLEAKAEARTMGDLTGCGLNPETLAEVVLVIVERDERSRLRARDRMNQLKLQAALDACCSPQSGVRVKGTLLTQIAFCGYCGTPLYMNSATRGAPSYPRRPRPGSEAQ